MTASPKGSTRLQNGDRGRERLPGDCGLIRRPQSSPVTEDHMNEDRFNMDIRKFLKVVGVTSQREIETAVRNALANGKVSETALLMPRVVLSIPELGLEHVVDGEIGLS
jgi:hypothetical protein